MKIVVNLDDDELDEDKVEEYLEQHFPDAEIEVNGNYGFFEVQVEDDNGIRLEGDERKKFVDQVVELLKNC